MNGGVVAIHVHVGLANSNYYCSCFSYHLEKYILYIVKCFFINTCTVVLSKELQCMILVVVHLIFPF